MEEQVYTSISIDIVGHDANSFMIMLQLPSGSVVPATISKPFFNKHFIPLFKHPPKPTAKPTALEPAPEPVKPKEDPIPSDIWWDVEALFSDMRIHARENERGIEYVEDPFRPECLVWRCKNTKKSWSLQIELLKEHLRKMAASPNQSLQSRAFQLSKCLNTAEGKQRLTASLNNF